MVNAFRDDTRMVFGPVSYFEKRGLTAKFQTLEFLGLVASGAGAALAGIPFLCNGANLAYRKDAFRQVKGFDGNEKYLSGDDVFLLHKMKKEFGRKAVIFNDDETSIVKTYPAPNMRKFLSQRVRWASKSKGYKDGLSILTAIVVFSYSLTVLLSFHRRLFQSSLFPGFRRIITDKDDCRFSVNAGNNPIYRAAKAIEVVPAVPGGLPGLYCSSGDGKLLWRKEMVEKIPNSKIQAPNKHQITKPKNKTIN
jgi:hypothetical protein